MLELKAEYAEGAELLRAVLCRSRRLRRSLEIKAGETKEGTATVRGELLELLDGGRAREV